MPSDSASVDVNWMRNLRWMTVDSVCVGRRRLHTIALDDDDDVAAVSMPRTTKPSTASCRQLRVLEVVKRGDRKAAVDLLSHLESAAAKTSTATAGACKGGGGNAKRGIQKPCTSSGKDDADALTLTSYLEAQDEFGDGTALIWAVSHGFDDLVGQLLAAGAAVNAQCSNNGMTALHVAAERGNAALVRRLVEWKADVNCRTLLRDTACHLAVYRGYTDIVRILLDAGTTWTSKNWRQNTVLDEALATGSPRTVAVVTRLINRQITGLHPCPPQPTPSPTECSGSCSGQFSSFDSYVSGTQSHSLFVQSPLLPSSYSSTAWGKR